MVSTGRFWKRSAGIVKRSTEKEWLCRQTICLIILSNWINKMQFENHQEKVYLSILAVSFPHTVL